MKKYILIIISAILLIAIGLFYYSNQREEKDLGNEAQSNVEKPIRKDVREVVWEQLPSKQKEFINGTWKDGEVSEVILNKNAIIVVEEKMQKMQKDRKVYMIDFPTKSKGVPNNMIVYADINTFDLIGYSLVD